MNDAFCQMFAESRAELEGQFFTAAMAHDERPVRLETYKRQFAERKFPPVEEWNITLWDGRKVWFELSNSFFEHPPYPIMLLSQFRDITGRKQAEASLNAALSDKDILLREVHHRVKNNLAVITGLLNLQRRAMSDEVSRSLLQDLTTRVQSMSLVHEKLYRSENLSNIGFQDYLETLVAQLRTSFGKRSGLDVRVEASGTQLDLDTAIPCGLVINELLTNSMKYAFPEGRPRAGEERCVIEVSIRKTATALTLVVADNGIGLPAETELAASKSIGLRLVQTIGQHQLGGKVEVDRSRGTRFTLTFPARR